MTRMFRHFRTGLSLILSILTIILFLGSSVCTESVMADSGSSISLIVLSEYSHTMPVGGEFYLIAITSTGKMPTFKSSNSSVASVNTYGLITAKKAGSCKITAKIKGAEASCKVKVEKTSVTLSRSSASMQNERTYQLTATSSTGNEITWKSSKTSVATVDEDGLVSSHSVGKCDITATCDGITKTCHITVKAPAIRLSKTSKKMYRGDTFSLSATVSSGKQVTWKSSKSSVAIVDSDGNITAISHGQAIITASCDGTSKTCTITVAQPSIKLSDSALTLAAGEEYHLNADVSSGAKPEWSSSNINVVSVDTDGNICARQKGKAYIYAKEDGVKVSCIVTVTE